MIEFCESKQRYSIFIENVDLGLKCFGCVKCAQIFIFRNHHELHIFNLYFTEIYLQINIRLNLYRYKY